jgi:hypothetical protein
MIPYGSPDEDSPTPHHAAHPRAERLRQVRAVTSDETVLAKVGRVTGRIGPGGVGEVMLPIRGGSEAFNAYALDPDEVIAVGSRIIVVEFEPPRTVRVQPYF